MFLKVKKLNDNATISKRETSGSIGYDLSSAYDYEVEPYGKVLIKTDIAVEIPEGHYGRFFIIFI